MESSFGIYSPCWQAAVPPHEMYMPMQVEGSWKLHRRDICMIKIPVSVWLIPCKSSAVIFCWHGLVIVACGEMKFQKSKFRHHQCWIEEHDFEKECRFKAISICQEISVDLYIAHMMSMLQKEQCRRWKLSYFFRVLCFPTGSSTAHLQQRPCVSPEDVEVAGSLWGPFFAGVEMNLCFFKGWSSKRKGPSFWSIGDFYRLFIGIYVSCFNLNIRPKRGEKCFWLKFQRTHSDSMDLTGFDNNSNSNTNNNTTMTGFAPHWFCTSFNFHFEICMSPLILQSGCQSSDD